jgi:hypothetical protein
LELASLMTTPRTLQKSRRETLTTEANSACSGAREHLVSHSSVQRAPLTLSVGRSTALCVSPHPTIRPV